MEAKKKDESFRVLVVDDNVNLVWSARQLLEMSGAAVDVAADLRGARKALRAGVYDVCLIDLMLPDGSGLDLVTEFQAAPDMRFVLMTGHPRLTLAVQKSCPSGAAFLPKPFSESDLIECIHRILPSRANGRSVTEDHFARWIGKSPAIIGVRKQLESVAPLNTTIFLLGESGTGKELAAETIHRLSGRSGPFLAVNCGAFPDTLIANELFGHEKGSFTGANKTQAGLFERARGGTVFLDEVTELPFEHQPHLLRVLEGKEVTRIGGHTAIPVDVRVVAASNRVDQPLVDDKILREDLFYRLMVFPVVLPPLRERRGDIREFVEMILAAWNREHGTNVTCSNAVIETLEQYDWPGNVRELKHTVQRLAILSNGHITEPPDFFDGFATGETPSSGVTVGRSIRDVEKELILATLEHYDHDRSRTAKTLGISQKTLYNRLKAYDKE